METAFFWLSKLIWFAIAPDSVLFILLLTAWIMLLRGAIKWSRRLLGLVVSTLLVLSVFPVGEWILYPLEDRFPTNPALPERVDGIIVLGGAEDAVRTAAWQQVEVNDSAERLIASMELGRRFPHARIVFTGGSGNPFDKSQRGSSVARKFYSQLGLDMNRVTFEEESRNTAENVSMSKALVKPAKGETWVLVTSALHMPRSVGIFCQAAWPVVPYPVDHRVVRGNLIRLDGSIGGNIGSLSHGIKEWIGLAAYYFTGRTGTLFPAGCNA